ncbi:angiopoietin-1 receptor-like isoform X2 [Acanthaster planci]|uniref:receptor protein-tyrosine kinase n=1 Tax=Acanthaster planci TaxID=133434 RepID=A0A8B7ZNB9_ACAPL|nr:angiopoietin-1 receptor-like isoform X2 [Acanthaster planci]
MASSLHLALFAVFSLSNLCSCSTQDIILTSKSQFITQGQETVFTCTVSDSIPKSSLVSWKLDDRLLNSTELNLKKQFEITLILNISALTLMCSLNPEGKNATLRIEFTDLPNNVTLEVNTTHFCESDKACRADVTIGRTYQFTCNASGSNPASNITWLITMNGPGETEERSIPADWSRSQKHENTSWDTSSQMNLQVFSHHKKISCRVRLRGKTAREISMLLNKTEHEIEKPITTHRTETVGHYTVRQNAIIFPTAAALFTFVVIATVLKIRLKQNWRNYKEDENLEMDEQNVQEDEGASRECNEFRTDHRDFNFSRAKLALYEVLGSGNFGQVYRATADGIYNSGVQSVVAVKIIKPSADADVVAEFRKEIEIQEGLTKHPNIVSMLGYCIEKEPFYLILEYLPRGNLQKYLRGRKDAWRDNTTEGDIPACPFQLLTFASQVACGMDYLSTMGCIHRDLATRNVLLSEDLVCKLSDFGLARDVSETEQYEKTSLGLIPVRWLALECLVENVYTTMSDVWSFGVLLWEIVTLGAHPYRGMSANEIIDALVEGFRLPTPLHCNNQLYNVMKECWRVSPSRRPSFYNLKKILDIMIPDAQVYLEMESFVADKYT